jgi:hypothetical protein
MSTTIRYELRITLDVAVDDGDDPRDYITQTEKSRLERMILQHLKKLDGDVEDIEVMDTTIVDDYCGDPREKGDDDGVEYGDPRDERDERSRS